MPYSHYHIDWDNYFTTSETVKKSKRHMDDFDIYHERSRISTDGQDPFLSSGKMNTIRPPTMESNVEDSGHIFGPIIDSSNINSQTYMIDISSKLRDKNEHLGPLNTKKKMLQKSVSYSSFMIGFNSTDVDVPDGSSKFNHLPRSSSMTKIYDTNKVKKTLNDYYRKKNKKTAEVSKAQKTMKKSVSYSALLSGHKLLNDVQKIPVKRNKISRPASMTGIALLARSNYNIDTSSNKNQKLSSESTHKAVASTVDLSETQQSYSRRTPAIDKDVGEIEYSDDYEVSFSTLIDDVKMQIIAFLEVPELRALMGTSLQHLALCRAEQHWLKFCEKEWSVLKHAKESWREKVSCLDAVEKIVFHDDLRIPISPSKFHSNTKSSNNGAVDTCVHSSQGEWDDLCPSKTNLSVLLEMTQPYPARIDEKFFLPNSLDRLAGEVSEHQEQNKSPEFREFTMKAASKAYSTKQEISVIQFTSNAGVSDRCIRSDVPFPSLRWTKTRRFPHFGFRSTFTRSKDKVLSFKFKSSTKMKTFVAPVVSEIVHVEKKDGRDEVIYNLNVTPRLLAYFEITLIQRDESQEPSSPRRMDRSRTFNRTDNVQNNSLSSECVAIGLSTSLFDTSKKFPGWDSSSFGYHGDDGGLFHANGVMIRRYGPKFGLGDTIGCGIDYVNKGIFFTLNGKFLGYGWTRINLRTPLYPTVGVDTNHPVALNFGSRPFAFDTNSFSSKHHFPSISNSLRGILNSGGGATSFFN